MSTIIMARLFWSLTLMPNFMTTPAVRCLTNARRHLHCQQLVKELYMPLFLLTLMNIMPQGLLYDVNSC